jgi:hypothetical protein
MLSSTSNNSLESGIAGGDTCKVDRAASDPARGHAERCGRETGANEEHTADGTAGSLAAEPEHTTTQEKQEHADTRTLTRQTHAHIQHADKGLRGAVYALCRTNCTCSLSTRPILQCQAPTRPDKSSLSPVSPTQAVSSWRLKPRRHHSTHSSLLGARTRQPPLEQLHASPAQHAPDFSVQLPSTSYRG